MDAMLEAARIYNEPRYLAAAEKGGLHASVRIGNTGTTPTNGWTLGWTFRGSESINNLWGGTVSQNGTAVSVTAADYTATIPAGGSVEIGFTATGTAGPAPDAFTLNGASCTSN
jgi:mannan endo-1,4-beta-mannosidase